MKRALLRVLLALACIGSACPEGYAQSQAEIVDSFYPRAEASEGENALFEYILSLLPAEGLSFRTFDFRDTEDFHSFSACLEITIAGARADTLIVCAPLDHAAKRSREESGIPNILLALGWLRKSLEEAPPLTLRFLFLGAEFGDEEVYPLGSRLFLEEFYPEAPVAVLYLNLAAGGGEILLRGASNRRVAPPWLVGGSLKSLKGAGLDFRVRGEELQLHRIGVKSERLLIEPYLAAGYPAVTLESRSSSSPAVTPERGEADWYARMDRFFASLTESFRDGLPESRDAHYLLFQIRRFVLVIPEAVYLLLLGVILGLSILVTQIYNKRFLVYLKWVLENGWFLLLLLAACFAFLLLATLAVGDVLRLRNDAELWKAWPFLFLALKFLIFGFLWIAATPLRVRLPYPRRKKFYSSAALLFLLIDTVVVSLFNISFSYYFLWAFLFVFLFSLFRNRTVKLLLLGASTFWLLKFCIEMFLVQEWEICRIILFSRVWGNFLLAGITLPFVLLLMKMTLLFPVSRRTEQALRWTGAAILGLSSVAGILFLALGSPYGRDSRQIVEVVNTIDTEGNRLSFDSTASLKRITYLYDGERGAIETDERRQTVALQSRPDLLDVAITRSPVLNRENVDLLLTAPARPYRLSLTLSSEKGFVLYGANLPFIREASPGDERVSYRILVGKNPPNPLRLFLTLPGDVEYTLSTATYFRESPLPLEISGEGLDFRTELIYREETAIR